MEVAIWPPYSSDVGSPIDIDPELLSPPEPDPGRPWQLLWLAMAAVALGGLLWWAPWADDLVDESSANGVAARSTVAVPPDSTSNSTFPSQLEDVTYDEEFLLYPRLLPRGYEHCWVADEFRETDRFCDPQSEDRWLNISFDHQIQLGSGTYATDFHSAESIEVGRRLVVPIGFAALVVTASGSSVDEILAVTESIPIVGEREALYSAPEVPLDVDSLTDEQIAGLVDADEPSGLTRYGGSFRLSAGDLSLNASPSFDPLYKFTSTMPMPRLVLRGGRPAIVGESAQGRWWATWMQRGLLLQLEGQGTSEDAVRMLALVGQGIDELP